MLDTSSRTLDDSWSWATSLSRTRLSSIDGLSLQTNPAVGVASDLQGILRVIQSLQLKQIPYHELPEIEFIGEGETFVVRKQQWKDQIVAVKHIKRNLLDATEEKYALKRQLRSVLQEILVMNHGPVAGHPNVTKLIGYGWQLEDGRPLPYMVVECGSMGCIRSYLQSRSPQCPIKHKTVLAGDIVAGLMTLHRSGIVHGDLKLDNVVLCPSTDRPSMCIAKLCDFGHSISLSAEDKSTYYYGTPLYLPPEALGQKMVPIAPENLHKCDIWAFGLALWEILLDGKPYFEHAWVGDSKYTKSASSTGSWLMAEREQSATGDLSSNGTGNELQRQESNHYFGDFDLVHLQKLAQQALMKVCPTQSWERSYLGPLLRSTLNPDPSKRMSDLSRSPIMLNWYSAVPRSALQAKMALHTRSSGNNFDMFRPDRQNHIPWEHQVHILADFQAIFDSGQSGARLAATAFQLMICQAMGFGCEIDVSKANQSLRRAIELDLSIARLLGDSLSDAFAPSLPTKTTTHTERMANGYSMQRILDRTSPLSLIKKAHLETPKIRCELSATAMNSTSVLLEKAVEFTNQDEHLILSETYLYSETQRIIFSWAQFAVLTNDQVFLQKKWDTVSAQVWDSVGTWEETPLMLACRTGRKDIAKALLSLGVDPTVTMGDNCNMFHWLFGLQDDAVEILDLAAQKISSQATTLISIDQVTITTYCLDPLWPTELTGSPLAFAIVAGNRYLVERLLDYGADVFAAFDVHIAKDREELEWTPIHLAVKYNLPEILQLLLDRAIATRPFNQLESLQLGEALSFLTAVERYGVHGRYSNDRLCETVETLPPRLLEQPSKFGTTPLWKGIDYENMDVVRALLKARPHLASRSIAKAGDARLWMLPLHYAAQICAGRGSKDTLVIPMEILERDESAISAPDSNGRVALHYSVSTNFAAVTQWLCAMGGNVNATDFLLRTPLMLCRSAANTKVLLEYGAQISLMDIDGLNSAHHAVARSVEDSLQTLIDKGVDLNLVARVQGTPLHFAAVGASRKCIDQLCQSKKSLDMGNLDGDTPLHLSVASKRSDITTQLIRYGANPAIINNEGLSPVDVAILQIGLRDAFDVDTQLKVFEALLSPTFLANQPVLKRKYLVHVLHACAEHGGYDLMKYFLVNDAWLASREINPDVRKKGRYPIHSAALYGRVGAARALLSIGGETANSLDDNEVTPLMVVCSADYNENVKSHFYDTLWENGADVAYINARGESAWSVAYKRLDYTVMTWVLKSCYKSSVECMLQKAPITWKLLDKALEAENVRFVDSCLLFWRYINFLGEFEVLDAIARALQCQTDRITVIEMLRALLNSHSDLVRDALRGRPVTDRMLERNLFSTHWDSLAMPLKSGDRDTDAEKIMSGRWVSAVIRKYLEAHEPDAVDPKWENMPVVDRVRRQNSTH